MRMRPPSLGGKGTVIDRKRIFIAHFLVRVIRRSAVNQQDTRCTTLEDSVRRVAKWREDFVDRGCFDYPRICLICQDVKFSRNLFTLYTSVV